MSQTHLTSKPAAPELLALIQTLGLEDSSAALALVPDEQLPALFDELLWGKDDAFDPARLIAALSALSEWGEARVMAALSALDDDQLTHALTQAAWVIDFDALIYERLTLSGPLPELERVLESTLSHEIDGFILLARQEDGFDQLFEALLLLDREDASRLRRLLDRAAAIAADALSAPDLLSDALSLAEGLADEVRGAREDRRATLGYVSAADAQAFLRGDPFSLEPDPILRAYLRRLDPARRAQTPRALLELSFLTNVLMASGAHEDPREAAREAARLVTLGLRGALEHEGAPSPRELTRLFKLGWG